MDPRPTFKKPDTAAGSDQQKFRFDKDALLRNRDIQTALNDLEELHQATAGEFENTSREIVNIPELFKFFLDDPEIYLESLGAKCIVALNESIPAHAKQDAILEKKYLTAWATLVAKVLHVLSSDDESHQLSVGGAGQYYDRNFVQLNFGTTGQRIDVKRNPERSKPWKLEYHLYQSDRAYGSKGFPLAMMRMFPDRFLVQTSTDNEPRKLLPGEQVPLVETSFIIDLKPGELNSDSDIDLPPAL